MLGLVSYISVLGLVYSEGINDDSVGKCNDTHDSLHFKMNYQSALPQYNNLYVI